MNILVSSNVLETSLYKSTSFYATSVALEDVTNKNKVSSDKTEKGIIFPVFIQECRPY